MSTIEEQLTAQEQGNVPEGEVHVPLEGVVEEVQAQQPPEQLITADEAVRYDEQRAANQAGWEGIAARHNKERPLLEKIAGRNEMSAEAVMQDEAQRLDARIDRETDPIGELSHPYKVPQTKAEALDEMLDWDEQTGGYFTPSDNSTEHLLRGRRIEQREHDVQPTAEAMNKALEAGDLRAADAAYTKLAAKFEYSGDAKRHLHLSEGDVTLLQHVGPALTKLTSEIFESQDHKKLDQLLGTNLLPLVGNVLRAPMEQRRTHEMSRVVQRHMAQEIRDFTPQLWHNDGKWSPAKVLMGRVNLLAKIGGRETGELSASREVVEASTTAVLASLTELLQRGCELNFPIEGYYLERMGLIDRQTFIEDPRVIRTAAMALAQQSPSIQKKAQRALKSEIGDDQSRM